tara:strand:+ start:53 stop:2416 length:2364 start_codon:yes stop_codon:yes gene_type:complete
MNNEFYKEIYSVRNAEYVLYASASLFNSLLYDKKEAEKSNKVNKLNGYDEVDKATYRIQVQKFCKKIVDNKGIILSSYKTAYNNPLGRQYVTDFGCQSLQYRLRGFLLDKSYIDYDCVNMHPTILQYLIKNKLNMTSPMLNDYCEDRDKILNNHQITKTEVLVAINSDINYSKNGWIKLLHNEIMEHKTNILKLEEFNKFPTTNVKNPISSKVNKIFCMIENRIIETVESEYKLTNLVKMFDGLMTPNQLDITRLNTLTAEYNITWKLKDSDTHIQLPSNWSTPNEAKLEKQKIKDEARLTKAREKKEAREQYLLAKEQIKKLKENQEFQDNKKKQQEFKTLVIQFEKENYKILNPLMFCRENKYGKANYNISDFRMVHSSMPKIEKQTFVDAWNDSGPRSYEKMDFLPYNKTNYINDPDIYNLFKPFTFITNPVQEDIKQGAELLKLVNDLLYTLAGSDTDCADFLRNCIAHMIQYPNILKETIIFLGGSEGVGKDTLIDLIECLLDNNDYVFRTAKPELIFGSFNSACESKLLIQINESSAVNAIKFLEDIKDFSSSKVVNVHKKGLDPYKVKNYSMVWFCSNNCNGIAPSNTNRRIAALWASDKLKGNTKFFKRFHDLTEKKEVLQYIFNYFNNLDLSSFNITKLPKSKLLDELQLNGIKPIYRFLKEILSKEHNTLKADNNQSIFNTADFKRNFDSYMTKHGYAIHSTTQKIKLDLREFNCVTKRHGKSRADHYIFNRKETMNRLEAVYFKNREDISDDDIFNDEDVMCPFGNSDSDSDNDLD